MNSPEGLKMGHSSKHIGLDCPIWRFADGQSRIAECLRSGGGARNFTVAGRQLGVSSSAIGKAVARMEERLGVRLFHRSTRSITLTAEGALFLERCRRIFSEIEAAELELS